MSYLPPKPHFITIMDQHDIIPRERFETWYNQEIKPLFEMATPIQCTMHVDEHDGFYYPNPGGTVDCLIIRKPSGE